MSGKVIPIALDTHYQGGSTTVGHLFWVQRPDLEVFGFTSADEPVLIDGVTYQSAQGLDVANIVTSAGLSVDDLELTTMHDESLFTRVDILSGVWNNSKFRVSKYNWRTPTDGQERLVTGTLGKVHIMADKVVVRLRGLQQYLQQTLVAVTSKTCRARLGDAKCRKNLASFTHDAAVTAVGSQQVFTASGLGQADDYFGAGELLWLTGDNAGLGALVKSFAAGVVTLMLPMLVPIQVGDTARFIAGCRKRRPEDCRDKFDNVLNFQGEHDLPGIDAMTRPPQ